MYIKCSNHRCDNEWRISPTVIEKSIRPYCARCGWQADLASVSHVMLQIAAR